MKYKTGILMFFLAIFFFFSQISYGMEKTYNEKPFINPLAPYIPFNGDMSCPGKVTWPEELNNRNPFGDPFQKTSETLCF